LHGVNGKLDDRAAVDDIYLPMEHGNPNSADSDAQRGEFVR